MPAAAEYGLVVSSRLGQSVGPARGEASPDVAFHVEGVLTTSIA
jgi:hypothetical protein